MKNLLIKLKLERLISIREAMITENEFRRTINSSVAYGEDSFMELAEEIKELINELNERIENESTNV